MTDRRGPLRNATALVHRLDHAIGMVGSSRDVLIEARTPVSLAVLGPIAGVLSAQPGVTLWFTSEHADRIRPLVPSGSFLTHAEVAWRRFTLYLNGDPWAAVHLRRCAYRVNFFHGVAGKYDLDRPEGLPMGFDVYDYVAFINQDRMRRYLDAAIVSPEQAILVGYPKLDCLANGELDGAEYRASIGLNPSRATVLYAPTYSEASSLHSAGEQIVQTLAAAGFNVIVKLHDRSLDPDPRYNGGIDWRRRFKDMQQHPGIRYVEGPDACPWLAAADLMVTDHSSIGFEYLILDRPLLIFNAPDLARAARINPEKIELLRSAAVVAHTPDELTSVAFDELRDPDRLSDRRRSVARQMFHEPGHATSRALALIAPLLRASTSPSRERTAGATPYAGDLS